MRRLPVEALPPPCISDAVIAWFDGGTPTSPSLTFHIWESLQAAGAIVVEPDEDDPNVTHLIYRLDVTPTDECLDPTHRYCKCGARRV